MESPSKDALHGRQRPPPTPRWVKTFALGAGVLVVVFLALHLTGIDLHGAH